MEGLAFLVALVVISALQPLSGEPLPSAGPVDDVADPVVNLLLTLIGLVVETAKALLNGCPPKCPLPVQEVAT